MSLLYCVEIMHEIGRGSVAEHPEKHLVHLLHVNAEVIPDGVVGFRKVTPMKLMLD